MAFIANLFNAHSGLEVVENLEILEESREEKCILSILLSFNINANLIQPSVIG